MRLSQFGWMGAGAAFALGFVVLSGFGHPWAHRGHFDENEVRKYTTWRVNDALDELEATEAQRQKIVSLKDDVLTRGFALAANHRATREELFSQWKSEHPDRNAVHAAVDRDVDELRALAHHAADDLLEAHDTLTAEQRARLAQRFEELHGDR